MPRPPPKTPSETPPRPPKRHTGWLPQEYHLLKNRRNKGPFQNLMCVKKSVLQKKKILKQAAIKFQQDLEEQDFIVEMLQRHKQKQEQEFLKNGLEYEIRTKASGSSPQSSQPIATIKHKIADGTGPNEGLAHTTEIKIDKNASAEDIKKIFNSVHESNKRLEKENPGVNFQHNLVIKLEGISPDEDVDVDEFLSNNQNLIKGLSQSDFEPNDISFIHSSGENLNNADKLAEAFKTNLKQIKPKSTSRGPSP